MKRTQEQFSELLKESIAPQLRTMGLKGSGQNYLIPSNSHWALLGFQKSAFSDSADLRFTINLFVVTKNEWDRVRAAKSYYPAKPTSSTFWSEGWHRRIGRLMPEKKDHWWTLAADTDLASLSREIVDTIMKCALPAMQEQMTGPNQASEATPEPAPGAEPSVPQG